MTVHRFMRFRFRIGLQHHVHMHRASCCARCHVIHMYCAQRAQPAAVRPRNQLLLSLFIGCHITMINACMRAGRSKSACKAVRGLLELLQEEYEYYVYELVYDGH